MGGCVLCVYENEFFMYISVLPVFHIIIICYLYSTLHFDGAIL